MSQVPYDLHLCHRKIKAETKVFKNELLVSRVYSLPITDLIKNMETKLFDNIMDITKDLNKINYVEEEFELIQKKQEIIQKQLEKTFIRKFVNY